MNSVHWQDLAVLDFCDMRGHFWQGAAAVMRVVLRLVHPSGIDTEIELLDAEVKTLETLINTLLSTGYRPRAGEWPKGPGGNPLCLKHQVEMPRHAKHDDRNGL